MQTRSRRWLALGAAAATLTGVTLEHPPAVDLRGHGRTGTRALGTSRHPDRERHPRTRAVHHVRRPGGHALGLSPAGYSEAIDPSVDTTRNGNRYLIYKIGNYTPRRFKIMALRVDDVTGTTKQGTPKVVLNADQIGSAVAEAPDVYRAPNGRVHLFVSRNGYRDCD